LVVACVAAVALCVTTAFIFHRPTSPGGPTPAK
jgi:hypothetical protein